jgi:hypothetical protein
MKRLKLFIARVTGAEARDLAAQLAAAEQHVKILRDLNANLAERTTRTAEEDALIAALRAPDRWQPDPAITPSEARQWGELLQTPLMLKIDVAMVNMAQQQAQAATQSTPDRIIYAAGVAWGYRAAWQVAKSISTMTGAEAGKPETNSDTALPGLDHLNP